MKLQNVCFSVTLTFSLFCHQGGASGVSSDSLSEADSKSIGSNLLDALSLSSSTTNPDSSRRDRETWAHTPQVPYIIQSCLKHLETYGEIFVAIRSLEIYGEIFVAIL